VSPGTENGAPIDAPSPPRPGEELHLDRLGAYLRERLPELSGPLAVEQFPSGYSNLTYLLRAGGRELVLRRPPFGSEVETAHDMGREHRVLSRLHAVYPLAPEPYLYCDDPEVLGAPFYLMERRRGIVLRRRPPPGVELGPERAARLGEAFVDNLARLHTLDHRGVGLGELGKPEGYVERQVRGWSERYRRARTHHWPELEGVAEWLEANRPAEAAEGLLHNDYKYDNLVLDPADPTRIVAVLDWEMCTVGDPLMDLGTTLAYWVEAGDDPALRAAAFGPTALPGSPTRRQLADGYLEATGFEPPAGLVFYYAYGLFKLAGIVQQIYYRYHHGHTRDPRFAELHQLVGLLGRVASAAVEQDRI